MTEARSIHLHVSVVSRGKGQRICSKAAYAEKTTIHDVALGKSYCYARKSAPSYKTTYRLGSRLPDGTYVDTASLWNAAEAAENRKNSCTGRTMDIALPLETDHKKNCELLENLRHWMADRWGVASTIAIHYEHENNPHAHFVWTSRTVDTDGVFGAKTRILDDKKTGATEIDALREKWADLCNNAIPANAPRFTAKSFESQNIDREPQIHLGAKAAALLNKGIITPRAERMLDIDELNTAKADLEAANARLANLENAEIREPGHKESRIQTPEPADSQPEHGPNTGTGTGAGTPHTARPAPNSNSQQPHRGNGKPIAGHEPNRQPPRGHHESIAPHADRQDQAESRPRHDSHSGATGPLGDNHTRTHSANQPNFPNPEPEQGLPKIPDPDLAAFSAIFDTTATHAAALLNAIESLQMETNREACSRAYRLAKKAETARRMTDIPGLTSPDPVWPQNQPKEAENDHSFRPEAGTPPENAPDAPRNAESGKPDLSPTNEPKRAPERPAGTYKPPRA